MNPYTTFEIDTTVIKNPIHFSPNPHVTKLDQKTVYPNCIKSCSHIKQVQNALIASHDEATIYYKGKKSILHALWDLKIALTLFH